MGMRVAVKCASGVELLLKRIRRPAYFARLATSAIGNPIGNGSHTNDLYYPFTTMGGAWTRTCARLRHLLRASGIVRDPHSWFVCCVCPVSSVGRGAWGAEGGNPLITNRSDQRRSGRGGVIQTRDGRARVASCSGLIYAFVTLAMYFNATRRARYAR